MRHSERGFTAVELLIVLLIVGLMMTVTLLSVSELMPRWRLRQAAIDVAASIRSARAAAVIDQAEIVMPFDVDRRVYTSVRSSSVSRLVTLPTGVQFSRPTSGTAVTLMPPSTSDTAARFGVTGLLQSTNQPGDVYVGIPSKGLYRRVRVSLPGAVSIERWDGSNWQLR